VQDKDELVSNSLLNQYKHIVDATNIVSKTDPKGIITYANSKFQEISGFSEDELIGKNHNIIRDPDVPASIFKELWATIKAKKNWHGSISNRAKNGEKYIVEASIFPILNQDGDIIEFIAIRHDITKRIKLAQQIENLRQHDIQQQQLGRQKLEAGVVNDLAANECEIIYHPSDILSGDFYSIYKCQNGSIFVYLLDGQGHGIAPALTVFSVSSIIEELVHNEPTLAKIIEKLFPRIKAFLGEEEQLSYAMIKISADSKSLSYTSGGTYPFFIKTKDNIVKVKANNTPFMNFSDSPISTDINIENWESLLVYSDGLVEHQDEALLDLSPTKLISEPKLITTLQKNIKNIKLEDDATLLYVKHI